MKRLIALPALVFPLLMPSLTCAQTQAVAQTSDPAYGLKVTTSQPIVAECDTSIGCFRVFVRVATTAPGIVGVGYLSPRDQEITDAIALSDTGLACQGYSMGGIPRVPLNNLGAPDWVSVSLAKIDFQNPATFLVEYRCDGPISRGSTINFQFSLAALKGGELPVYHPTIPGGVARWSFDSLILK